MSVIWNTCGLCGGLLHRARGLDWFDQSNSSIGETPVGHTHDPWGPWKEADPPLVPKLLELDRSAGTAEARNLLLNLLDDDGTLYGNGTGTYEERQVKAERHTIALNGPTAYVWLLFDEERDLDHAFIEVWSGGEGPRLLPIPRNREAHVFNIIRQDAAERRRHGA